jgi:hypothetical protein
MEHKMILMDADFRTIKKMVIAKRKASLVEQEQRHTRNVQDAVRGCEEAPQDSELSVE